MKTLISYIPLLLCPAMMVACIAGPRLLGRKSSNQPGVPALHGDVLPPGAATATADAAGAELGALRAEVALLRTMVPPPSGRAGGAPASSVDTYAQPEHG